MTRGFRRCHAQMTDGFHRDRDLPWPGASFPVTLLRTASRNHRHHARLSRTRSGDFTGLVISSSVMDSMRNVRRIQRPTARIVGSVVGFLHYLPEGDDEECRKLHPESRRTARHGTASGFTIYLCRFRSRDTTFLAAFVNAAGRPYGLKGALKDLVLDLLKARLPRIEQFAIRPFHQPGRGENFNGSPIRGGLVPVTGR